MALAREGVPFYFLYATIHATEVGTTQTLIEVAHRLATEQSPEIAEILDNVVLLMVPSQNPDGQHLVIDHWYDTRGTGYDRTYPDLRGWTTTTRGTTTTATGSCSRRRRPGSPSTSTAS